MTPICLSEPTQRRQPTNFGWALECDRFQRNWREKSCRVLGGAGHLLDARRSYSRLLKPALGGLGGAAIALAKMSSPPLSRALTARKI